MKVAFLAAACCPHTIKWANAMAGNGHAVTVHSMPDQKEENGELRGEIEIQYLPVESTQGGAKKNAKQLKPALASGGYDAVVAMDMSSYGLLAAKAGAQNVLLVAMGTDIYGAKAAGTTGAIKKAVKAARGVLATAPNIITKIKEVYKKEQNYFVAPFGVDMELFCKKEVQKSDAPCFGSIKFLESINNVDVVLEAFARYTQQNDDGATLKVVGCGPQESALKNMAQSKGIGERVEFLGYVKNSELPDVINTMDIVVQMTAEESFGVSGVEAMACEVPLVASDTVGVSEYVLNHVTGYLVKVGNVDACAQKMAEAVKNPEMRKRMGVSCREDVLEKYSLPDCVKKFEDALKQVAK